MPALGLRPSSDLPRLTLISGICAAALYLVGAVELFVLESPFFFVVGILTSLATAGFAAAAAVKIVRAGLGGRDILLTAVGAALAVASPVMFVLLCSLASLS